jgi:hypothetical protein
MRSVSGAAAHPFGGCAANIHLLGKHGLLCFYVPQKLRAYR